MITIPTHYTLAMPETRTPQIQQFIDRFLAEPETPLVSPESILIDTFGDSPEMADRLLSLVLAGTKTATCSSLWAWQAECELPLRVGTLAVIVDGSGYPRCVLETTGVRVMPYNEVPASFARDEGEHEPLELPDEQVLEHWRRGHWAFFARTLPPLGLSPTPEMPVVCEHFRVVYQEPREEGRSRV